MRLIRERAGFGALVVIAVTVAGTDLWTKALAVDRLSDGTVHAVLPMLDLRLAFNHGISFSLLPAHDATSLVVLLALQGMLTALVAGLAFRATGASEGVGFAIMTGGALGNLIDRCADGRVTDFLDLHPAEVHWFTFNMADIWISLGAALIAWEAVGKPGRPRPPAPLDPAALRAP